MGVQSVKPKTRTRKIRMNDSIESVAIPTNRLKKSLHKSPKLLLRRK